MLDHAYFPTLEAATVASVSAGVHAAYEDRDGIQAALRAGLADGTLPATTLDAALRKVGEHSELLVLPGIGHQFVGDTARATHEASVKVLDRSIEFIDATVGKR